VNRAELRNLLTAAKNPFNIIGQEQISSIATASGICLFNFFKRHKKEEN